jgi:flagellar hook-associated protein 3 FlgL
LAIGFGARANEPGFMSALAGTAMLAVTSFSTTDESLAKQQFSEMRDRARSFFSQSKADVVATSVSVMNSQKIAKTNSDDHKAQKSVFETALADVENVPLDQTAVSLTSVQTQLQALYQLTAKLQSLSLANYL